MEAKEEEKAKIEEEKQKEKEAKQKEKEEKQKEKESGKGGKQKKSFAEKAIEKTANSALSTIGRKIGNSLFKGFYK